MIMRFRADLSLDLKGTMPQICGRQDGTRQVRPSLGCTATWSACLKLNTAKPLPNRTSGP